MAKPLNQFMLERGITPLVTTQSIPTANIGVSDVMAEVPSAIGKVIGKPLRWAGKELMKPVSSVAVTSEQIGKAISGEGLGALGQIPSKVGGILTGRTERSFSDIWRENLPNNQLAGTIIGTVIDIVADPLNFAGPGLVKVAEKAGKTIGKIPTVSKALEAIKPLFSTATKNKEFDAVIQHYRDLGDFRRAEILDGARMLQKEVSKLKPDEVIEISNKIEKGVKSVNPKVNEIADQLSSVYKQWKSVEKEMGIKGGELAQYAPHIKVQEKQGIMGMAREFSNKLRGAEKTRTVLKFTTEDGTELVGKASTLGLKETAEGLFKDETGKLYQSVQASIDEINTAFGKKFFEENPAIQTAYRGLTHSKAITGQEFFNGVRQFATQVGTESTAPALKGLRFEPEVARAIDTYYQSIKPDEIRTIFRVYDGTLNWWKAQALIAPSYHIRNVVSNIWNNFLAGVKSPIDYIQAGLVQTGKDVQFTDKLGKVWNTEKIVNWAKRTRVVNEGWYAKDIPTAIESQITKGNWNPLSQNNVAFRLNKQIGTAFENNSRMALFINRLKEGDSVDKAAMTVKKFLFDYGDLTNFEKNVMKRVFPFYTWTRKNIPLQLENLISQPGKYAGLEKTVKAIEQIGMGDTRPVDEKYLSDYIKNNTAMKIKYDDKEKTYYYFLLGNWMPSYQAMDFLSQPLENLMQMLTPLVKTPMELMANKSSFFKNTLGDYTTIEAYPGQTTNFLGLNMSKKAATVLRNIRLLSEIDKLNPGKIFGGEKGEPSLLEKMGMPAISVPGMGVISPSKEKYQKGEPSPSIGMRVATTMFGKLQPYKVEQSREFYQRDTDARIQELKTAIKSAARKGDKERVKLLNEELRKFQRERGR